MKTYIEVKSVAPVTPATAVCTMSQIPSSLSGGKPSPFKTSRRTQTHSWPANTVVYWASSNISEEQLRREVFPGGLIGPFPCPVSISTNSPAWERETGLEGAELGPIALFGPSWGTWFVNEKGGHLQVWYCGQLMNSLDHCRVCVQ